MSFESSGADYLRHLKQEQDPPDVAHGPVSEPARKEGTASPQERRQSTRYKCEGSAQFRVNGSDVHTWGTFTDISVHGCYVEMTATYPVGGVVDLLLELNGIRAHVLGDVRVSYPCLGMGIAFQKVSPEEMVHLQQMIASLAAPVRATSSGEEKPPGSSSLTLPLIVNAGAAIKALAEFFEGHGILSKEEFVRILRKSQDGSEFRDHWR